MRALAGFMYDPISQSFALAQRHGPHVMMRLPLRLVNTPRIAAFTADGALNREILSAPDLWRTVNISATGPVGHASRRLANGLVRMRGPRHAYYRRLLVPPLRQAKVRDLGTAMAEIGTTEVAGWPLDQPVDLWALTQRLMQRLALALLFGGDSRQGEEVANAIVAMAEASTFVPGRAYIKYLRDAGRLERLILDWAATRRGRLDENDLLSIVVNSPDEASRPVSEEIIAGHVPTLFGAAYETCQSALIWSLILLAQHPQVASDLHDELDGGVGGEAPMFDRVGGLPLLDAVVKETMRLLPPVPMQFRVATAATTLGGRAVPARTRVVLSSIVTNRNPRIYQDANCFMPERWQSINPTPFECSVFSAGPRHCPGYAFGTSMVKVALAAIMPKLRVELPAGLKLGYRVRVSLNPYPGVPARLVRQDGAFATTPIGGAIRQIVRLPG